MQLVTLLSLLSGCGTDVAVGKTAVDNDTDGYTAEVDCNDAAASVHPEAPETCDGVDQDCDGEVDDGATDAPTWFADVDVDLHGDAATAVTACEAPAGAVALGDDCDDAEPRAFPGNVEVCDGVDNDCDGAVDDDAADASTWYADGDGDAFGVTATAVIACEAPPGTVSMSGDCDDADPAVHPEAAEDDCLDPTDYNCDGSVAYADADGDGFAACEDCDDSAADVNPGAPEVCGGSDEDCDDLVDEDDPGLTDGTTWYRDADGDAYAPDTAASTVACTLPVGFTATRGDCDDTDGAVHPGATEVCDAADRDEDCDRLADDADGSVDSATWQSFHADVDADSYGDPARAVTQCDAPGGWVTDATDCDDAVGRVHPGATETCDGVDEDCDGIVDDGSADGSTWYADADGDGVGGATTASGCAAPLGYVAASGDCDDADGSVHPGAAEACDAVDRDEDCDGLADDADPSVDPATRTTTWTDADGDRFGDPSLPVSACDPAAGQVGDATDCDDTASGVHPGATESCDGVDEDCNGEVDDGATDVRSWPVDADGDGHGGPTTTLACAAPAGTPSVTDDCDDADGTVYPGAADACGDGLDADCDGIDPTCPLAGVLSGDDVAAKIIESSDARRLPAELDNAGDVNGDGFEDLLAADEYWSGSAVYQGAGLVFFGPISGTVLATDADLVFEGPTEQDRVRRATALGDLNGDGLDDLALSSYLANPTGYPNYEGEAWVLLSPFSGTTSLATADGDFYGGADYAACGYQLAGVGDVTGDGVPDVAFGGGNSAQSADNYVTVKPGPATGHGSCQGAGIKLTGTTTTAALGPVGYGGDLDGDGVDDLVVGSMFDQSGGFYYGAVFVEFGPITGAMSMSGADRAYYGDSSNEWFGSEMLGVGDLDGDGHGDLVAASSNESVAYLLYGPLPAAKTTMSSVADATFAGSASGDGRNFDTIEDLDGDGARELLVGWPSDATYGSGSGAVGVFAAPSGTVTLDDALIAIHGDSEAVGVSPIAYDADGDGSDGIAVGAIRDSEGGDQAGAIWIF